MTDSKNKYAVIMAGGIGTRFWPLSRVEFPKQFQDLLGVGKSMIRLTFERLQGLIPVENIYVITNKSYKDLTLEQLPELKGNQVLLEPVGRNTAPCIAYACYKIGQANPDACISVLPADHLVTNTEEFKKDLDYALNMVSYNDKLVTLGIKPSRPDTGYGYIQFLQESIDKLKKVKTFTEKPQVELAKQFVESGDFVWNAGIFVWNYRAIRNNFMQHLNEIHELFHQEAVYNNTEEQGFVDKTYSQCPSISIDYGIMEKSDDVYVLLTDFGWSDVGTWKSLYELSDTKDDTSNVIIGNVKNYDSKNCMLRATGDKLLVAEGLEDYIVVVDGNVTMICRKENEQKVKDFVTNLKIENEVNYI